MSEPWRIIEGVVLRGHGVASGTGLDRRYPTSTLRMQKPFFAERGLDLSAFHEGTLNLDIAPNRFALAKPAFTFRRVTWTDLHPPEDFSFSHCRLRHQGIVHLGWVYTPHPETKAAHFQPSTMLEIIAPFIDGLTYGAKVELHLKPEQITLAKGAS